MTGAPDRESRRARAASRLLVATLAVLFLISVAGFVSAVMDAEPDDTEPTLPAASATPRASLSSEPAGAAVDGGDGVRFRLAAAQSSPNPALSPSPAALDGPPPAAAGAEADVLDGTAAIGEEVALPVVPVVGFWSTSSDISRRDIKSALETGKARGHKHVVVDRDISAALEEALSTRLHADVRTRSVKGVESAVAKGALGFLAATDVTPRVRALDVNGMSLFGNDRVRRNAQWPLSVRVAGTDVTESSGETADGETLAGEPVAEPTGAEPAATIVPDGTDAVARSDHEGWAQARTWVLVAGGDSFTDRGVYENVVNKGKGVDFPFDGGTARVTGHGCCDPVFNDNVVPRYVLTGNKGRLRRFFRDAELAIANHELPVTDGWVHHRSGTRFSGKPELTRIFTRAGIDWVSLANNHIRDYGSEGIKDTRRILKRYGIGFGGAGKDLAQARRISYLDSGVARIAIIPCVGVAPSAWAGPDKSGGTPCKDRILVPDIKEAARKADFVIVFPHWGVEYTRKPLPSMRKHAARWAKAGADLILGAHSHVAGAIEDIDGTPVLYSLGNLIFDQHWSTNTMESFLLEATFHGDRLVQLRLHPYIVHSQSQPNLLDAAKGEGRRLLREVKAASSAWLDW